MKESSFWLNTNEVIIISGCFSDNIAWKICSSEVSLPQTEPLYCTNSEEADTRMWRHAIKCDASTVLIHSADTDVYMIGLQFVQHYTKNFIVQINQPSSSNKVYLYLNNFLDDFLSDSDLSSLPLKIKYQT